MSDDPTRADLLYVEAGCQVGGQGWRARIEGDWAGVRVGAKVAVEGGPDKEWISDSFYMEGLIVTDILVTLHLVAIDCRALQVMDWDPKQAAVLHMAAEVFMSMFASQQAVEWLAPEVLGPLHA